MKTKVVYVVVSDETDIFLEQALLSVFSLRKYNPNAFVELVVDSETDSTIKGKRAEILKLVDKKTVVEVSSEYKKAPKSRWLKTSLRQLVSGDFLYVDTDTIVTDNLEDIDTFEGDLGAVADRHTTLRNHFGKDRLKKEAEKGGWTYSDDMIWFNGGLLFVRDNEFANSFFSEWNSQWKKSYSNTKRLTDQVPLCITNEHFNYPIKELPGEWNCQIAMNGVSFLAGAKIIHYLAYGVDGHAWKFYDKEILKEIKEKGIVTDWISELVNNAKRAFYIPNKVVVGKDIELLNSQLVTLCKKSDGFFRFFNFMARSVLKISRIIYKA
jgi:lipopolysaccharide biosynthesis glycosyltransferase